MIDRDSRKTYGKPTRAGIAGMRGLLGFRYLYQELEKIVTYEAEMPRQLMVDKSREGEGLSQSVGITTRTSPHQREICHLPLSDCRCRVCEDRTIVGRRNPG